VFCSNFWSVSQSSFLHLTVLFQPLQSLHPLFGCEKITQFSHLCVFFMLHGHITALCHFLVSLHSYFSFHSFYNYLIAKWYLHLDWYIYEHYVYEYHSHNIETSKRNNTSYLENNVRRRVTIKWTWSMRVWTGFTWFIARFNGEIFRIW
jgi:hypothetical protein